MSARTIHPFPARMAPEIATNFLPVGEGSPLAVLDPMCGSGTVLSVAAERGHNATGLDIDPLAVLMSRVATCPYDTYNLLETAEQTGANAQQSCSSDILWEDSETIKFAEYWFGEEQRTQLAKLSRSIDELNDADTKNVLQIALSRIIVTKSPKASLAGDTSHSRPHRVVTTSDYNVFSGFSQSVKDLRRILEKRNLSGETQVTLGDSRSMPEMPSESFDLVISSPPYLNAIDYLRGHKMALIWLGYTIPELRQIRSVSIGAERALRHSTHERVTAMVEDVRSTVSYPDRLPIPTITRYAHDVCLFADELFRISSPGARIVMVVGNSTLRGNFIRNDKLVSNALLNSGYTLEDRIERDLPANRRYLPIGTKNDGSSMTKRMRTEVILAFTKT